MADRERVGRDASPLAAIIDSHMSTARQGCRAIFCEPPQDSIPTTIGGSFWKNATISLRRSFLRKTGCSAAFTPCN
jgi:hypothetical protein